MKEKEITPEMMNYFLEKNGKENLLIKISIEGTKKILTSKIPLEKFELLYKLNGEYSSIMSPIINSIMGEFIDSFWKEKIKGENSKVPDIDNIINELEKVKEEKAKDDSDLSDFSSTALLRKELMKNYYNNPNGKKDGEIMKEIEENQFMQNTILNAEKGSKLENFLKKEEKESKEKINSKSSK